MARFVDALRARWWLLVPSVALVAVAAWVLARSWGPLWAGHPAYPVTLLVAGLLGVLGLLAALRRLPPRG